MFVSNFLTDTSAWLEYFKGSRLGEGARQIIEDKANACFYCNIVISETASKALRDGENAEEMIKAIMLLSKPANETVKDAFDAGVLHAKRRLAGKEFSLADAVIATLAKKNKCKILTKDFHLKEFNAVLLE